MRVASRRPRSVTSSSARQRRASSSRARSSALADASTRPSASLASSHSRAASLTGSPITVYSKRDSAPTLPATARLCELAKEADGRVLASAGALERAREEEARRWREDEAVTLRGRREETRLAVPA